MSEGSYFTGSALDVCSCSDLADNDNPSISSADTVRVKEVLDNDALAERVGALRKRILDDINSLTLILIKQDDMGIKTRKRLEDDLQNAGLCISTGGGGLYRYMLAKARRAPSADRTNKLN